MSARWLSLLPAVLILSLAVFLRLIDPAPVANLRLSAFDSYLRANPRQADPDYPVRIVAIDEASLKELGQWPWPRTVLAKLYDRLTNAGVKTISLDVILAEEDRLSPSAFAKTIAQTDVTDALRRELEALPANDLIFEKAIQNAPAVIGFAGDASSSGQLIEPKAAIATAGDDPAPFVPAFPKAISSLPKLAQAAKGFGATNWLPERDQIIRRVPLLFRIADTVYPSLSLEALRLANNESTIFIKSSGSSGALTFGQSTGIELLRVGKTILPVNGKGELWLRMAEPDPKRTLSAQYILSDAFDPKDVAGRHIFIGASAVGLLDLRATPLSESIPGVEVHAQALEQMLSGDHAIRPAFATGYELLFLIAAGIGIAALIIKLGPIAAAGAGVLAITAVGYGSWLAYQNAGLLFDPVYPALALVALYVTGSLARYVLSEQQRAQIRTAFSSYVAPQLVEELANNPQKLKLGGETRDVTLLFADVRQFSTRSEGLEAEELIRFVNELFEPLSDIIMEERGTIDKFMGDAVMAFWNAPLDDPKHAANACTAALRMQQRLQDMNKNWQQEAKTQGQSFTPVGLGIGLNTGTCCVGNMGSSQRFDYSVIGDAVNVASRLEGQTKVFATPIIVGEETAKAASGFAFLPLDKIIPRGKSVAQNIYALIGDQNLANTKDFQALHKAHKELVDALSANNLTEAKAALLACQKFDGFGYLQLRSHYEARLSKEDSNNT